MDRYRELPINLRRSFVAVFSLLFVVCLWAADIPREIAPLWDTAVRALHQQDQETAARLLNQWIEKGAEAGIQSPEAHYNLGLANWKMNRPGSAVYHLLISAKLRSTPLGALKALNTLDIAEKQLGIKNPVTESISFWMYFLINRNWISALLSISLWSFIASGIFYWLRGKKAGAIVPSLLVFGGLTLLVSAGGFLNRNFHLQLAVADSPDDSISIYRGSQESADSKIAEIPSGTIVITGRNTTTHINVLDPVPGWVRISDLKRFQL